MTNTQKKRFYFVLGILLVTALVVTLIIYALSENMNLYFTPSEVKSNSLPLTHRIKLGGIVLENSVKKQKDLKIDFKVTDFKAEIPVRYEGILPDLFSENKGVVLVGKFQQNGYFLAETVLAKHDSYYAPKIPTPHSNAIPKT